MRRFAPAVATGLLMAGAFPPLDLGFLALVAPVPLLLSWREARPRRAALDAFVAGTVFFGLLVLWAWHFGVVAYFPFVLVLAAYWAAAGAIVGAFASRGIWSPWLVAAVWVVFEALRGRFPFGGFSWGEVGYAAHDIPVLRSLAGWGGVLLLSFVMVAFAVIVADFLRERRVGERRGARTAGPLVAIASLVVVAHLALPATDPTAEIRAAIVQGNDLNRSLTSQEIDDRYLPRSHFALAEGLGSSVDLVIFPESSLDEDPRLDPFLDSELTDTARRIDAAVLANAAVEIEDGRRLHNTNFFYGPEGALQGTYVKQHLVPYGEYVPGRSILEGVIDEIDQIPRDYAAGDVRKEFEVSGVRIGNLICFESAFTELARGYARDGVEVLVVSTNNRSFRRSANSAQHVAIGQIRAIETGRPVLHAGISGISAVIDPDGDVVARTELFERTTLEHTVTGRSGRTPYVALGDWVLIVAAVLMIAAAFRARGRGQFAARPGPS